MKLSRKAGLMLHEGQNMPNGDHQKDRAGAQNMRSDTEVIGAHQQMH